MSLLAALFMVGMVQAQDAEKDVNGNFWNLKVGTVMTFSNTMNTEAGEVKGAELTVMVARVEGGVCTLNSSADGHSANNYMGFKNGYFVWGAQGADGKFEARMQLFKNGAKVGDSWNGWVKQGPDAPDVTVTYVDKGELKVAAGTFKDVVHVQASVAGGLTFDYYFAPKAGMIKFVVATEGTVNRTLEMTTLTEAK
jgi:hypothetical protein